MTEHEGVFIRKFDRIKGLFLVGLGHGRVLLRRRGHQQAGAQYGSGPCFLYLPLDRGLLPTYSFVFIIKNVSWTGPVATMYEQIGFNVTDTVASVIWAIAAGKSRIDEGARSVVLGLSCRSHGTSPWQWNAVYNAPSFGFTASGFATFFLWLQVPNMTKSHRVIRDTSTRRDHGTSTNDRVFRAGASCVLRGVSTCWVLCTSASHRASACCVMRGASSRRVRCASASGRVHRASAGRDCDGSTFDQIHRANTCCVIRGARSSCVRCASASGRVYRASTGRSFVAPAAAVHAAPAPAVSCVASCRVCCATTRGRVHCTSACRVLRGASAPAPAVSM